MIGESEMTVQTNNHKRQFTYRSEVPESVLADQFDYLDDDDGFDGFLRYRDYWYHVSDFMNAPPELADRYNGFAADTFFSGVAINISDGGETYRIATVFA